MGRAAFSSAVAEHSNTPLDEDDQSFLTLQRLERLILDHRPDTSAEAISILDIVIPDMTAGGRSDGRDVSALINIRALLTTL